MAKANNTVASAKIRVTVSEQSEELLEQLARQGIYGRNSAEVAGRFIDQALQQFIKPPKLRLRSQPKRNPGGR